MSRPFALFVAVLSSACSARAVDFDTEIIPLLTKSGCNAGACHGAAAGRGGFKLSLLGGDAAADYDAIVLERKGRRVNLSKPDQSLVFLKPTGELPHEGGIRLADGSAGEKRLLEWLKDGAPRVKRSRKLTGIAVKPEFATVVSKPGDTVRFTVLASYDSGFPDNDVTNWTVFTSSDPASVEVDVTGTATVKRPGRHVVTARFLNMVVHMTITLPIGDKPVDLSREPATNFIDDEVYKTLAKLRLPVSPRCDDATFLRRILFDLTGRVPSPEDVAVFLADQDAGKRAKLIGRVLRSDDFIEYQTFRLTTLLRIRPLPGDKVGAKAFHDWMREQVRQSVPYDQTAATILTASGDTHANGPAYFARLTNDARGQAELVSGVFLGVRLQCANCHNHPLDRWTQDDYHGLAAVFAKLTRGPTVTVAARGGVTNPRTGEPAVPRIPGEKYLSDSGDGRRDFADWLTGKNNRYFAKATVNRLWKQMYGRGLVEPADDLRDTNPSTHPVLLLLLADDFVEHGYDLRRTLRLIATSETYMRSNAPTAANKSDDRYYSRSYRRPLEPEVLADAIADVTGVPEKYGRAVAQFDVTTPAPSLDILGRCSRTASCEGEAGKGGLPAKLHVLNGELINRKITSKDGRLHKLIVAGKTDAEIVAEFYVRAFGRQPTEAESKEWLKRLATSRDRTAALEDLLWAVLNSSEFTHNR